MNSKPIEPISYDPSGALIDPTGVSPGDLEQLLPKLEAARREMLDVDLKLYQSGRFGTESQPTGRVGTESQPTGGTVPARKEPLDAGFHELPERILAEYESRGETSELARILTTARRLAEATDRVVVLGIGGSYMGARALMESCCEPYFNELGRAERGGRSRMYFEGNNVDNDASQGLLRLLGANASGGGKPAASVDDRWSIVVISKSGGTLETAVAFRQFLAALKNSAGGDAKRLAELVVPVTGQSGRLFELSQALGCQEMFHVPDGVGGRFSVLSPVGLLPAALLGLDVVRLLRGAAAMNEHFRTAPPEKNAVLQYVGTCHLWEARRGASIRVLSAWSKSLESVGLWYDQLLAESNGKQGIGATPLTVVNTRDLHSRAQQHQEGRRDKLMTNLIVDRWRCDPLKVGRSELNQDGLNDLAEKSLPEIMQAAIAGTNQAYREDGRPAADLHLPVVDEGTIGQLFQMLMLATVLEGRLIGVNPYGQPGVEQYKRNMNKNLGRK
jgi:glucose-6-phosphate isomerase